MTLPVVRLKGTPYDQGLKHGRELRERIHHNVEVYLKRIETEGQLPREETFSRARKYLDAISRQNADYHSEMRGISEGSGADLDGITLLTIRYEILYNQFRVLAPTQGCTSFALLPGKTAEGNLTLAQNWDWIPQVKGAMLHYIDPDGLEVLCFTEAGIPGGKIGFNSDGIALLVNGMVSTDDDWSTLRKPYHVRCYEILRSRDIGSAVNVVKGRERSCSANFMIAQAPDKVINVEATPTRTHESMCKGGVLTHTNHFVDPDEIGAIEPHLEDHHFSYTRYDRINELLRTGEPLAVDQIKAALRDHVNRPYSICKHVDESKTPEKHYATVVSVILGLHTGTMEMSDGPPCENRYRKIKLKGYGPKMDERGPVGSK
jgi:isopenicillin-N N-acyltransferase-like protein